MTSRHNILHITVFSYDSKFLVLMKQLCICILRETLYINLFVYLVKEFVTGKGILQYHLNYLLLLVKVFTSSWENEFHILPSRVRGG